MTALTTAFYNRTTQKDWIGKRLVSLVPIETGRAIMPAGTVWTVEQKFGGLSVLSDACPHCGIQMRAAKCSPVHFALAEVGR